MSPGGVAVRTAAGIARRKIEDELAEDEDDVHLPPLQTQTLTEAELQRAANLGKIGPRDVTGLVMTHCVPNERVVVAK